MKKINWQNKYLWVGVGAILIVLILVLLGNKNEDDLVIGEESALMDRSQNTESEPEVKKEGQTTSNLTYQQALNKYGDRRIQFDANCQARPNNMTYKNGTEIMLDNRAKVGRSIKIGITYNLPSYGFKIIKLSSPSIPAKFLVDCDKFQNVATITLQK